MSESLTRLRGATKHHVHVEELPYQNVDVSLESLFPGNPLISARPKSSGVGAGDRLRAALEDHGGVDPTFDYVEREEFEKHVEEDMHEHDELREEVRELKGYSEVIGDAKSILGSVAASGSERPAAVAISNEAFRSFARELKVTAPEPSFEAMDGWVTKLKNFLRIAVANYSNAARNGVIRPVKSLSVVNTNLEKTRRELDKLEYRDGVEVFLDSNTVRALSMNGRLPSLEDLMGAVSDMVNAVVTVHLTGTDIYTLSAEAIRKAIEEMDTLPETDEEFEAVLKKAAGLVQSPGVYYEIVPQDQVFPGNVSFKPVDFEPVRNYPSWFEPVLRMDSAPFFEMVKNKANVVRDGSYVINTTQLSQILDFVEEAISHLYEADKKWTEKVVEMHRICKETIDKAEKWPAEDVSKFSTMNKRMLDIAMKNLLLMPVVLSQPTTVMLNPLIDSLYGLVTLVALAVKKAK